MKRISKNAYARDYFKCHSRLLTDSYSYQSKRVKNIIQHLKRDKKGIILEAGCGSGGVLFELKKRGFSVYGIDFSYDAMSIVKKNDKNINVVCSDLYLLPFKDKVFDAVILSDVVEHLSTPRKVYKEIHRVLKSNGYIIVSTAPNKKNIFYVLLKFLSYLGLRHREIDPLHINEQSPFQLMKELEQGGFKIEYTRMNEPYKLLPSVITNYCPLLLQTILSDRITVRAVK